MSDIHSSLTLFARKYSEYTSKERRSKWPYYTEEIATSVKTLLDKLHESKHPQKIFAEGITVNTLRAQYYQGVQYLVDHMDTEQKYRKLLTKTKCLSYHDQNYIELRYRQTSRITPEATLEVVEWKDDLMKFLEDATPGDKFHRDCIALSEDDITWAHGLIDPLGEIFISDIKPSSILVIKDIK